MFPSVWRGHPAPAGHLPSSQLTRMDRPGTGFIRMQFHPEAGRPAGMQSWQLSRSVRVAGLGLAALHRVQMRPPGFPETIAGMRQQPHRFQGLAILLPARIPTHPQEAMPGLSMSVFALISIVISIDLSTRDKCCELLCRRLRVVQRCPVAERRRQGPEDSACGWPVHFDCGRQEHDHLLPFDEHLISARVPHAHDGTPR